MGRYVRGDVLLVSVSLDDRTGPKIRPVIVISTGENGSVCVCPVSIKPPSDAPVIPLSIDDFATGGLDLFSESYVMISRVTNIHNRGIVGKKGRLTAESVGTITSSLQDILPPGTGQDQKKKPDRLHLGQ